MERCLESPLVSAAADVGSVRGRLGNAWRAIRAWVCRAAGRRRQRRALAWLDDRLLDDVGLTREQARIEATKPFWR